MPRISGDGAGGAKSSGIGGWFGGAAARVMTGTGGSGYVILGGTKYGVRLSQESIPAENTQEERKTDSKECLSPSDAQKTPEKIANDCCCIGPRSKLPLPRLPIISPCTKSHRDTTTLIGSSASSHQQQSESKIIGNERDEVRQTTTSPTSKFEQSTRLPPNLNSNNNCGGQQQQMVTSSTSSTQPQSSGVVSLSSSSSSSSSSVSNNLPIKSNAGQNTCCFTPIQHNSVSVSRSIAQWTKHHTLKLQEPAITAVDRLQRFRWSGGGNQAGRGGKKSASSGHRSEKAERLRELTEKLKNPAPTPPPRRPSRTHTASPPTVTHQANPSQTVRSHTYSEGSSSPPLANNIENKKKLVRSESVGDECHQNENQHHHSTTDDNGNPPQSPNHHETTPSRRTSKSSDIVVNRHSGDIEHVKRAERYSEPKHYRQCSDSLIDSTKCVSDISCSAVVSCGSNESEARDGLSRLEPRGPLLSFHRAAPCRSASFGQVDFNQGNRNRSQATSPTNSNSEPPEFRASTLPRRRGNSNDNNTSSPQAKSPDRQQSPCASTPSVDSAVGSAEGLGGHQSRILEDELRPRSDGSDSLATSSAVTSPEPPPVVIQENSPGIIQQELTSPVHIIIPDQVHQGEGPDELEAKVIITPPPEEPRLSQASETSEAPSETPSESASSPSGKVRRYRGDTSKRRKGVYITQWPEPTESERNKLSTQSSEEKEEPPAAALSDVSDCEGHTPRRYSKRPLRGPYGQMLEAEMAKPRSTDIALDENIRQRRKISANLSYSPGSNSNSEPPTPCHHRTTSSPSKLEGLPGPSPELLAELLRGSSERVSRSPAHRNDTRTHVVVELYDTEKSYVEALQILVNKYLQTLKNSENAGLVDAAVVDEIFYQIPAILSHHEVFLEELRKRLETWEFQQTIGDIFLNVFTKSVVLEAYTLFLDNWKSAKKAIKTTCQTKPAFARFLETMEREHKGKLGLDQLLIKPVQKIPRYELLIQRLLKHTDSNHPDHELLTIAQKEIHELVVKINCTERESLEWEQQQTTLKEVQSLVEGLAGIVANDRAFVRHDLVTIASNQGTRKERALFLFSDLLVITSIKRRSGTIRKPSTNSCPNSLVGLLEANKYKLLMRISLDDLEVMKAKDENLRRMAREVDYLREDCATLSQLQELAGTLHGPKHQLEELIKELLGQTQRQLAERNAAHSQLACLELTLNTQSGIENISIMFTKPDKRASWEECFNEAKQKLALSADRRPCPEFVGPLPIRKTRAGLQFTCATPTIINGQGVRDVWVCNSDGYVGQVCVLSLTPEPPQVTSCNGVCNARILCVAGIPAGSSSSDSNTLDKKTFRMSKSGISISVQDADVSSGNIQLDSSSSSDDSDSEEIPCADATTTGSLLGDESSIDGTIDEDLNQPTMWLGTEDGCIHVYNCNDNIRIKKNKVKIQHGSSVHSIMYVDEKVFVSLANGDVAVYCRDHCGWNTSDPTIVSVGSPSAPVTKMIAISEKLWCSCHNTVKVLNINSLEIEHTLSVSGDNSRQISCMATSGGMGVWISLHNSAVLKLYQANTYECLTEINIAPAVTKMLSSCDDIIRQHKAACLRVTALLACNDLLWIGTSAGVLLTVPIPHMKPSTQRLSQTPQVTGIPHGHTGHVRFLTCVEIPSSTKPEPRPKVNIYSMNSKTPQNNIEWKKLLVISGGDGYEDFRGPQASAELQAGREDSTNHLLLWKI